jgi:hypothetical protein
MDLLMPCAAGVKTVRKPVSKTARTKIAITVSMSVNPRSVAWDFGFRGRWFENFIGSEIFP